MSGNISAIDHLLAYTSRLDDIALFKKVIANWYDVVLFRAGVRTNITVMLRSGRAVVIMNREDYTKFFGSPEFQTELMKAQGVNARFTVKGNNVFVRYKGKPLKFVHSSSLNEIPSIIGEFFLEEYKDLNVKAKTVVDIGASIGDSAIYFALNGANHVYAFEPYPHPFDVAKTNVAANGLSKRITLLNEGLGKKGFVRLASNIENTVGMAVKEAKSGKKIRINSLDDVVKRYKIRDAALKVDCEGGEYPIILDAEEKTLHAFTDIAIEYHYGYIDLVRKLRSAGFSVRYTTPKMMQEPGERAMLMGMITARRQSE